MPNPIKDWRIILIILGSILMMSSLFMTWGLMVAPSRSLPDDDEFVNTYFVDEEGQVGKLPGSDPDNPLLRSNIPGGILAHATKDPMIFIVPVVAVVTLVLVIYLLASRMIYQQIGLLSVWVGICVIGLIVLAAGPLRHELFHAVFGLGFLTYAGGTVLMVVGSFVLQFFGKEERQRIRVEMEMAGERDRIVKSTQAIREDPTKSRPYLTRGYAYKRRSQVAEAIADLEKYLELSSEERSKEIVRKEVERLKAQSG